MKPSHVRLAEESEKLQEQVKSFQATFENIKFHGEDQILVVDFLTTFVKEADTLDEPDTHEFLIMQKVFNGRAERHLRSIRNGARPVGFTYLPGVFNHSLWTYETPTTIQNAINNLRNIRTQWQKDELSYSGRINAAAYRCGNVHDEINNMKIFLNGLLPSTQTVVARVQ